MRSAQFSQPIVSNTLHLFLEQNRPSSVSAFTFWLSTSSLAGTFG